MFFTFLHLKNNPAPADNRISPLVTPQASQKGGEILLSAGAVFWNGAEFFFGGSDQIFLLLT